MGLSLTLTKERGCRLILPDGREVAITMTKLNGRAAGSPGVMLKFDAPPDVTILRDGVDEEHREAKHEL